MSGELERCIFKGDLSPRAFNPLARKYAKEIYPGEWVLELPEVREVYQRVIDGEEHVYYLGPKGLEELENFLAQIDSIED